MHPTLTLHYTLHTTLDATTRPRSAALLQLLCAYADRYGALLEGKCEDMPLGELHGGARIR